MRILFVNPRSINRDALPIPPLGILYLAAHIKKNGFNDIKVIDNNFYRMREEDLENEISSADIIAVTGTTSQYFDAKQIASFAKKHGKISILGGSHGSALPHETLKNSDFDYVIIGEGEITFLELLNNLDGDKSTINGLVYRDPKNGVVINPKRELIKNIDEIPMPDRSLIPILEYGNKELKRFSGHYTHMMSSRGCSSKCTFCSSPVMWKKCRMASAKYVFDEMKYLYDNYGIANIHFQDDSFTLSRKRIVELCCLIKNSGIGFKWSCLTRPDKVDEELLVMMKDSGCVQMEYGVESGDENILRTSKKGYTKKQIFDAFRLTRKVGIKTLGFFIIGLPGENIWTWIKSIIFAKQIRADSCHWTVIVPFPGTEIYENNLVTILNKDYTFWLYKEPIVRVGILGPKILKIMRVIADKIVNGFSNTGPYKTKIGKRIELKV